MRHAIDYETDEKTFNADAYQVKGYRGIACSVDGWEVEHVFEEYETECVCCDRTSEDSDECAYCEGSGKVWAQDEEPTERRTGQVVFHMIGDDRRILCDESDLTPIAREEYCGECGQLGCTHDGLDRTEEESQ